MLFEKTAKVEIVKSHGNLSIFIPMESLTGKNINTCRINCLSLLIWGSQPMVKMGTGREPTNILSVIAQMVEQGLDIIFSRGSQFK